MTNHANLPGKFFSQTPASRSKDFWNDSDEDTVEFSKSRPRVVLPSNPYQHRRHPAAHIPVAAPKKEIPPEIRECFRKGQIESSLYLKDKYVKPLSACEIVTAGDGIFQVQTYRAYTIITQLSDIKNQYLDQYLTDGRHIGFHMHCPKIPFEAMQVIYSFFFDIYDGKNQTKKESEAMTQTFYAPDGYKHLYGELEESVVNGIVEINDNWFVYIPLQSITAASVDYKRNGKLESMFMCVIDIHSHDSMGAFFSATDNNDEKEPRFYGVLGSMPWSENKRADKRVICRYQTKINDDLGRHEISIFKLFERPKLDTSTSPILNQMVAMIEANKLTDSEVICFYADLIGKVTIPESILDRCKLERREFKGTVISSTKEKTQKNKGNQMTLEEYENFVQGGMFSQQHLFDESESPIWSSYISDHPTERDMPPGVQYSPVPVEAEVNYDEFIKSLMNEASIYTLLALSQFIEHQTMVQKLREDLREDVYAINKLIVEKIIDEDDLEEPFMDIFEKHHGKVAEAYHEYNLESIQENIF